MMLNMRGTRRGHQRSLKDKGLTEHVGQNNNIHSNNKWQPKLRGDNSNAIKQKQVYQYMVYDSSNKHHR